MVWFPKRTSTSTPTSSSPSTKSTSSSDLVASIDSVASWHRDDVFAPELVSLDLAPIEPIAIPIRLPALKTKVKGFVFPNANRPFVPPAVGNLAEPTDEQRQRKRNTKKSSHGRIKPPSDIVKLQDRLFYMLQPPLESLVGSGQLNFPFEPFPYQLDGMAFLFPRYAGILADEMGLGKTMQAISTIRLLLCSGEVSNVLLVCPKPLVTNWLREFSVWAPEIPIVAIEGNSAKREFQWTSPQVPVKVANYELLMRDHTILEEHDLHFDLVVLDEAQRIKNRTSTTAEVIRSIKRTRSWALTGTPVENCPDDLVGIFEFLSPGYLKPGMPMHQIAKHAGDFILRRTKDMVLDDMPPKLYRDAELDLTPEQWATYEAAETEGVVHLENLEQSLTIQHVFELVLRLKQICNFDPVTGSSCKLERLVADIEEVAASGKKAIVFSQWVKSLDKIKAALQPYGPLEYHGKIPHKKRNGVIDQFKNDPNSHVILMSYGAGSVGLNLQFCEYVFLFDRWWNPAIEDQAINRAHRLGAAGAVTVTKMMAVGTIEQRINDVLDQKREMFDTLFSSHEQPTRNVGLSRDEIFGLFDLRAPCGKKVA
ncbi:DEAD/DEAH box helicase [Stieleria sp. JC731]|uniref:DEAD/DEAH box helicase n=1 Tax=Pirellulaceae TaxID=2691357 RepID=UPI001E4DAE0D|nr:DEAD/DEAH box helicase [Stieleria sp. JC731]MCC9602848.1 DEAD/DEAH box helicase [Stieleria sp. JC731]